MIDVLQEPPMNLDDWRSRINNLDDEILKLLNQRGTAALRASLVELANSKYCTYTSESN